MVIKMSIYKLTSTGKKVASNIGKANSDESKVLDALYDGPADEKEVSISSGVPSNKAKRILNKLCTKHLVENAERGMQQ